MEDDVDNVSNQMEDYGEEDYGESNFPGEKPSKVQLIKEQIKKNRKILLFFVVLTILIVISLIACASILIPVLVTSGSSSDNNDATPNTAYYDGNDDYGDYGTDPVIECCLDDFPYHNRIWNTIEYQLGLQDPSIFKNRQNQCDLYLAKFNSLTGLDFTYANGNQSVREEYDLKTPNCQSTTEIRVRMYITGPKEGYTTTDVKMNGHSQQEILDYPLYPSNAHAATSYQKAEMDQHECTSKYSRETRETMESPFWFTTCQSVKNLYPGLYPTLTNSELELTVSNGSMAHWWVLEHTTNEFPTLLPNGTTAYSKLDSTFTLQYGSLQDAINGKTPTYGEWSFRLYAQSVGPTVYINPDISHYCLNIYHTMVAEFEVGNSC